MFNTAPQIINTITIRMDEKTLWKTILAELQLTLTPGSYQTLFSKSSLLSLNNNVAHVALANAQIKSMVEDRYYALLKEIVDRITKNNNSLVFEIHAPISEQKAGSLGPLFDLTTSRQEKTGEDIIETLRRLHIKPDFTFENFAVSGSNQLAYAAASAVTKNPGSAYNPLYLWGGVGVGKTHLMHAIAQVILSRNLNANILYFASEEFTNELTFAIKNKTADKFRAKYRKADVLLIDDVQFIAGKDSTQEEFFHTFNVLQREGKQVILTSDKPPHEIAMLEDRIRSRFEGGLVVDIQQPDMELRTAILMIKAKQRGLDFPISLAQIAAQELTGARTIEGFIVKLINQTSDGGAVLDENLISGLLGRAKQNTTATKPDPKKVLSAVCSFYDIKVADIKGERRKREFVRPRQILMWLLHKESGLTLEQVGAFLGGRDHSTVLHGEDMVKSLMDSSETFKNEVLGIKQRLLG